jgi:cellulose synthase/poly-beta-1,6-N-acetylglucosamine synthase-like glycosyltransferase
MMLKILFWMFLAVILYAYIGYTLLLLVLSGVRKVYSKSIESLPREPEPEVTLIIPAYNEADCVAAKVRNSFELQYPREKMKILWVTDGSTDDTVELLRKYPGITVIHESERKGKIHAMNRCMKTISTPLVVFTDANTLLNPEALHEITRLFSDKRTGCVTGEKRIYSSDMQKAVDAGEGLYWAYESWIKRLESETGSAMGAVGELFAIRSDMYHPVKEDTLLDDFTLSMQILQRGYRIRYAPKAWGTETASVSIREEMKRKTRIAAGGMQALTRMASLLNPFRFGRITLMYFSHKVLRWTLVPVGFPLLFVLNFLLVIEPGIGKTYIVLFILQCLYYLLVLAGGVLHNVRLRFRALFVPYYLFIMNYAIMKGFVQFITGHYSVNWQKVRRS